jgi:hypothetical protein
MKSDLAHGLEQLDAWRDFILPRPQKTFVVGTYLREITDRHSDPSLVAFVDPDGDGPPKDEAVEFPADWIRRANYGAWLTGMGFVESGESLQTGRTAATQAATLQILPIGRQQFAVTPLDRDCCIPFPSLDWPEWLYFWRRSGMWPDLPVIGIEVRRLRAVERAVNADGVNLTTLMQESQIVDDHMRDIAFPEWLSGSVMPDGTLLGSIHLDRAGWESVRGSFKL